MDKLHRTLQESRLWGKEKPHYAVCARCVMDTSDIGIMFDEKGFCNHCNEYFNTRERVVSANLSKQNSLDELFHKIRVAGRDSKYDCVIGVSGGVDSSYVALLAARSNLRILAVHLDNCWDSSVAVRNIGRLVKSLNLSYQSYVLPWNELKKIQRAFFVASVPEVETPTDIAIQKSIYHFSRKYNVPYILGGGNMATEGILPATWHYDAHDTRYSYSVLRASGLSKDIYGNFKFDLLSRFKAIILLGINTAYVLNYLPYSRASAKIELEEAIGWEDYGTKHGESILTKFVQTYYLPIKHGIDYRRATYSSEICRGHLTREEALRMLEDPPYDPKEINRDLEFVAMRLDWTIDELCSLIKQPAKWYFDYTNNQKFLAMIYDTYRFISRKKRLASF